LEYRGVKVSIVTSTDLHKTMVDPRFLDSVTGFFTSDKASSYVSEFEDRSGAFFIRAEMGSRCVFLLGMLSNGALRMSRVDEDHLVSDAVVGVAVHALSLTPDVALIDVAPFGAPTANL
jgi:hypothetical protein